MFQEINYEFYIVSSNFHSVSLYQISKNKPNKMQYLSIASNLLIHFYLNYNQLIKMYLRIQ